MSYSQTTITPDVCELLAATLGIPVDSINLDDVLADLPEMSSINVVRMVAKIEQRFDITIPDEDIFEARTVSDIVATVQRVHAAASDMPI